MNDLSTSKLFSMGYDTNYELRNTLLMILMGMILLFMGVGILTSSQLKYLVTSSASHLTKNEMISMIGWENPYFAQDSRQHLAASPSIMILKDLIGSRPENINFLLNEEIPGLSGSNSQTSANTVKETANQSAAATTANGHKRHAAAKHTDQQKRASHNQAKTQNDTTSAGSNSHAKDSKQQAAHSKSQVANPNQKTAHTQKHATHANHKTSQPQSLAIQWKNSVISQFGQQVIPEKYLPIYKAAAKKYGIPWNLLAAIHRVETDFNQNLAVSSAGAIGPTQFMTCTWIGWSYPGCNGLGNAAVPENVLTNPADIKKYGGYGVDANGDGKADPMNVKDAIYSTAHYLAANGGKNGDFKQAVFAYNHSQAYVQAVMTNARRYVTKSVPVNGQAASPKSKQ